VPLDEIAKRFANQLFAQALERSSSERQERKEAIIRDFARRNMIESGGYASAMADAAIRHVEAIAKARADSLLKAYAKAGEPLDDQAVASIMSEVENCCRPAPVMEGLRSSLGSQMHSMPALEKSLANRLEMECGQIIATIRRDLVIQKDSALLEKRRLSAAGSNGKYSLFKERSADLDPLLRIPNRGEFDKDIVEVLSDAAPERPLGLVLVDIDHFKEINDGYGHPVGDRVLKEIARLIDSACLGKGRCYRYGGEEIAVLLPNYSVAEAFSLCERIRIALSLATFEGYPRKVTASFGIGCHPETTELAENLIKDADSAMYEAKRMGRNQVRIASRNQGSTTPNNYNTVRNQATK